MEKKANIVYLSGMCRGCCDHWGFFECSGSDIWISEQKWEAVFKECFQFVNSGNIKLQLFVTGISFCTS